MVTAAMERTELLDDERCDRCGARGAVHAITSGGRELVFCAHHGREYAERLRADGFEVMGLN
jgi:hypothetical protein